MGMPHSVEACPFDGVCWGVGQTPKIIYATVNGIRKISSDPLLPAPPNGLFALEQKSESLWQYDNEDYQHQLFLDAETSAYNIMVKVGDTAFSLTIGQSCQIVYVSMGGLPSYDGGVIILGWFGPAGAWGSVRNDIKTLLGDPNGKVQVEMYGAIDQKRVERFANKFDKTCVYIKKA